MNPTDAIIRIKSDCKRYPGCVTTQSVTICGEGLSATGVIGQNSHEYTLSKQLYPKVDLCSWDSIPRQTNDAQQNQGSGVRFPPNIADVIDRQVRSGRVFSEGRLVPYSRQIRKKLAFWALPNQRGVRTRTSSISTCATLDLDTVVDSYRVGQLFLQQAEMDKTLGGRDDDFLAGSWRPAESATGFLVA